MKKLIARIVYALMIRYVASVRRPDEILHNYNGDVYLLRWWLYRYPEKACIAAATGWRKRWLQWRFDHLGAKYLHCFVSSDDDRAKHDHPCDYWSYIVKNQYREHRKEPWCYPPIVELEGADGLEITYSNKPDSAREMTVTRLYSPGAFRFGDAETTHRIELFREEKRPYASIMPLFRWMTNEEMWTIGQMGVTETFIPVWTLFSFGPVRREWGFWCKQGWVHNREYSRQGGCGAPA